MRRPLSVVFLGNDPWSVPSLGALLASRHRVPLVVTSPPRPSGRGQRPTATPVAEAARRAGITVLETERVGGDDAVSWIAGVEPDALAVVAFGQLLPPSLLASPPLGAVNLHFSLLPDLRGASPVRSAILRGAGTTGVTTIRMSDDLDAGPILLRREEPIRADDDAGSLGARLAAVGAVLLVETLDRLGDGDLAGEPQDLAAVTWCRKLTPEDREITWSAPTDAVIARIRAFAPDPGARTRVGDRVLKVLAAAAADGSGEPGKVLSAGDSGVVIATGDGAVAILSAAPSGRARMGGGDLARGGHVRVGEVLG